MKKALTITASVLVLLAVSWKAGTEVFDRKAPCFSASAEIYVYPNMTNADVLEEERWGKGLSQVQDRALRDF